MQTVEQHQGVGHVLKAAGSNAVLSSRVACDRNHLFTMLAGLSGNL